MDTTISVPTKQASPVGTELIARMQSWRHDIHAHPETAFAEARTSALVAQALKNMGLEVHTGLAKTGVVATLKRGAGPTIGLRADLDGLDIHELSQVPHQSTIPGKMHGCGHDGHTAMLLGAAQYLSQNHDFSGTVHFIFQPAEENEGGGRVMIEEGLFELFPCDAVFGLHNAPSLPLGTISTRVGTIMSSFDTFELTLTGKGSHAAQPEAGVDPIVMSGQLIQALQTIVSRNVSAIDSLIISITQIHGGDTWNVIPEKVVLRGTCRTFLRTTRDKALSRIQKVCEGVALACGGSIDVQFFPGYPACVNSQLETEQAAHAARLVVGADRVDANCTPRTGSEDFAYMLEKCPGAYVLLGAARPENNPPLHNPYFDFNDDVLALGAEYWITLVKSLCVKG
ncbi:amidohydrolase [Alcaligenaceae bacterium]|nr:amidohydrolase [Alcaligenaceae bacterium]